MRAEQAGYKEGKKRAFAILGIIFNKQGELSLTSRDYIRAEKYFERSLICAQQINDTSREMCALENLRKIAHLAFEQAQRAGGQVAAERYRQRFFASQEQAQAVIRGAVPRQPDDKLLYNH